MLRRILLVVPLALTILLSAIDPADAQTGRRAEPRPFEKGFGFSTMFVYTSFESIVAIDNYIGISFRCGYYFTPHHELESLFNFGSTEGNVIIGGLPSNYYAGIDTFHFQFAYNYNFRPSGVVPYLTAGLGFLNIYDDSTGSETDLTLGVGAGIRFFVTPVFNYRLEYRFNRFEGDGRVFVRGENFDFNEFSFGVGWRFPS